MASFFQRGDRSDFRFMHTIMASFGGLATVGVDFLKMSYNILNFKRGAMASFRDVATDDVAMLGVVFPKLV